MPTVNPAQSNPGDTIEASDINTPVNQLAAVVNGNIETVNLADNAVSTAKIADGAITGAKISTYKVLRQDNTTNSTESAARMLTGWGVITPGTAAAGAEVVTFNSAFTSRPIVVLVCGGDNASSTTYGDGAVNIKQAYGVAHTVTTTGFTALVRSTDGSNWGSGNTVFYQWVAIGT